MNGRELIAWSRKHDGRAGRSVIVTPLVIAVLGGVLAAWTNQRGERAWLVGTLVAFGINYLRVPFLIYWRADAPLLAQLPIPGRALFDAALARCAGAAIVTTAIVVIGAVPIFTIKHLAIVGALALSAACLMPAVAVFAASLVDRNILATVTAVGGAPADPAASPSAAGGQSSALLGALPGFAGTIILVVVVLASPWLRGEATKLSPPALIGGLAIGSVLALLAARSSTAQQMGTILRDVSALDRQRLATLEIRPPTAIERAVAKLTGDGALSYSKDARLVRRRYPMAFALGALVFFVLVVVGIAQPESGETWLVGTLAAAGAYAVALAGRLRRPPIELARVSRSLPIEPAAIRRAKVAWLLGWMTIFVVLPGLFATIRVMRFHV